MMNAITRTTSFIVIPIELNSFNLVLECVPTEF